MRSVGQATSALRALVLFGLVGCGNLEPIAPHQPITDPAQMYMTLVLDHPAVNLSTSAPYNTLQLSVTPLNGVGELMAGLPAPTFRSSDTTAVKVTSDGMLTALKVATGVQVIAELVGPGNVRRADTAMVNVKNLPTPPLLTSFSIHPLPSDSAIISVGSDGDFTTGIYLQFAGLTKLNQLSLSRHLRALDPVGDSIPGLAIEYQSLDPTIVTVNRRTGNMVPIRPGQARMIAQTVVYGVAKVDTVVFTVLPPWTQNLYVTTTAGIPSIFGATLTLRTYGIVFWINRIGHPVDVIFDDPTNVAAPPAALCTLAGVEKCGTGNFSVSYDSASTYSTMRIRQFPVPGTYTYHDTQTGSVGQIIVSDEVTP